MFAGLDGFSRKLGDAVFSPMTGFAATLTGLAIAVSWWSLVGIELVDPAESERERRRRRELAEISGVFRWLGRPARALSSLVAQRMPHAAARLDHQLDLLNREPWRGDEFAAAKILESLPVVMLVGAVGYWLGALQGAIIAAVFALAITPLVLLYDLRLKADRYVKAIRQRLPFTLDLMTLVMEAGVGTLPECIRRAAAEHRNHPIGDELCRVLTGLEQGAAQAALLDGMDRRLADGDVKELVMTLNTAEERGVPLKDALRGQAERMQRRQIQWLEKSAEEAKVHITWPSLVVMVACLLIQAVPFLLHSVQGLG